MRRNRKITLEKKSQKDVTMIKEIDRNKVTKAFSDYTAAYDASDSKIKLKIDHTYRVAALCERIAKSERMSQEDADLAWLLGMLHDIGRFEQLRKFGTFNDAESVDHAKLGADILFQEGKIRDYVTEEAEDFLIEQAIRVHNAFRVPENMDTRVECLSHILRDADKIDILKVNVEVPLEEIYNTTTEELRHSKVSESVMQSFYEHHATLKSIKCTPADHVVGHISLVFELVFKESLRIVKEQGCLAELLNFHTENLKTQRQFVLLREEMEKYFKTL